MTGVFYFLAVGGLAALAFVSGVRRLGRPEHEDVYMRYKRELADRSDLDRDALTPRSRT